VWDAGQSALSLGGVKSRGVKSSRGVKVEFKEQLFEEQQCEE